MSGRPSHAAPTQLPYALVVVRPEVVPTHALADAIAAYVALRVAPHKVHPMHDRTARSASPDPPPAQRLRGGVRFVGAIPKSPSGKILRRILRQQQQEGHASPPPVAKL
jgi:acyl-coenzyme A synthetase/AMP-(fatty) acid ligase